MGVARARPEHLAEVRALSLTQVRRSRGGPGCLAHGVARDLDDPLRIVRAEALAVLHAHVALPASRAFAVTLRHWAAEPPTMQVYGASPAQP